VGFLAHMPELMDFKRAVSVRVKMNNIDFWNTCYMHILYEVSLIFSWLQ
jgi:trans-aconitate methyltransferase